MKKLIIPVVIVLGLAYFYYSLTPRASSWPNKTFDEVEALLDESPDKTLDFRKIKSVDWDEALFMGGYSSLCYHKLRSEEKGEDCEETRESDLFLILIKDNSVAAKIALSQQKLDKQSLPLETRIPRAPRKEDIRPAFNTLHFFEDVRVVDEASDCLGEAFWFYESQGKIVDGDYSLMEGPCDYPKQRVRNLNYDPDTKKVSFSITLFNGTETRTFNGVINDSGLTGSWTYTSKDKSYQNEITYPKEEPPK